MLIGLRSKRPMSAQRSAVSAIDTSFAYYSVWAVVALLDRTLLRGKRKPTCFR